jgi:serine/threonine-protein kinase SRPK3
VSRAKPMWDSFRDILTRNPTQRFTTEMLKTALPRIFLALDYLHTECKIVHTGRPLLFHTYLWISRTKDIKADNILIELADTDLLDTFVQEELACPSPRKFVDGIPIYMSHIFGLPKQIWEFVISDLGSAIRGDER